MTLVGIWVVFFQDWRNANLIKERNELVRQVGTAMLLVICLCGWHVLVQGISLA